MIIQQVRPRTQPRMQRNHDRLAQRIDRRVRHLCKSLPEKRIQRPRRPSQKCQRRIVPHRPHRVFPACSHRLQNHLDVFLGVHKTALLCHQVSSCHRSICNQPSQRFILHQHVVRHLRVEGLQHFFIVINLVLRHIDAKHLPRPQPSAFNQRFRVEIHQPSL